MLYAAQKGAAVISGSHVLRRFDRASLPAPVTIRCRVVQVLYAGNHGIGQPLVDSEQPGRVRVRLVNHPESETCIRALKATTIGASAHASTVAA